MIGRGGGVAEPVREAALDLGNSRFDAALDGGDIFGEFGVRDVPGGGFIGHCRLRRWRSSRRMRKLPGSAILSGMSARYRAT
jgi:hypothetical protein